MKNFIKNQICGKFETLIPSFFKDELNKTEEKFFKGHFHNCIACQQKYFVMQKIYQNFKKVDEKYSKVTATIKNFTINEYNILNENLSAYIDKELNTQENLTVKKIIIKNIFAQNNYKQLDKLISLVKDDFNEYSSSINFKEIVRNIYFYLTKFNIKS